MALRKEDFEAGIGPWRMSTSEYGDVVLIQDTARGFQMLHNFRNLEEAEKALEILNKKWKV